MKSRLFASMLILALASVSCNKKDTDNTAQNSQPAPTAAPAPAPSTDTSAMQNQAQQPAAPVSNAPGPATEAKKEPAVIKPTVLPAGTTITIRLSQDVGSKISKTGDSFSGSLARAVTVGGVTVIPSGAAATGTIVDAKPLGRFAGGASLEMKLASVQIHGNDTSVETSAVTQVEKGKGKRTAVLGGGGAALGAIIGGIAGGGKGAAIGALAGGGAGTGGAAFTGNKDIVVPAETLLSFKLAQPLTVRHRD